MEVFTIDCGKEWDGVLAEAYKSDFYHTHAYHALSESRGEGLAHLWVHREGDYMIALPLLMRPLEGIPGFGVLGTGWWDATSVYGYAGPIASHPDIPEGVLNNFQRELERNLRERRVIAVFSRLHPLLLNEGLIAGLGEQAPSGWTVSIDLTLSPAEQERRFRSSDRRRIKNMRRQDYVFINDRERRYLPEFVALYTETMKRVSADEYYFFDKSYFEALIERLAPDSHLFLLLANGAPVCGGVFIERCGILEYLLGGTRDGAVSLAPAKLLIDEVRLWATSKGYATLHLGGGFGGRADSLLFFKRGFSDRLHQFLVWRWILNPVAYSASCRYKAAMDACQSRRAASPHYFPAYRGSSISQPLLLKGRKG